MNALGLRIALARSTAGMSGLELGRALGISSTGAISEYETGARKPRPARLAEIARVTGVDLTWLTTGDGNIRDSLPNKDAVTDELRDLHARVEGARMGVQSHNRESALNLDELRDHLRRQEEINKRLEETGRLVERADQAMRETTIEEALPLVIDAVRAQGGLDEALTALAAEGQDLIRRTLALRVAGEIAGDLPPGPTGGADAADDPGAKQRSADAAWRAAQAARVASQAHAPQKPRAPRGTRGAQGR